MAGDFTLDFAAIGRVLRQEPATTELRRRAEIVVADARAAPRSSRAGGHEVDKITVGATHTDESGAVIDIDWASSVWHLIEFGSQNNPPYRPITRAAQNAGLQIIDNRQSR